VRRVLINIPPASVWNYGFADPAARRAPDLGAAAD